MSKKNGQTPIVNVGTSSLLIIFIILCMAVFAALSISSAKSDMSFSQKQADRITAYYDANNKAEEIVAAIDDKIKSGNTLTEAVISGFGVNECEIKTDEASGTTISFPVEMSEDQSLKVELVIPDGEKNYKITTWMVVNTSEWEAQGNTGFIQFD